MHKDKDLKPLEDAIEQVLDAMVDLKSDQGLSPSMARMLAFAEFVKLTTEKFGPNTAETKQSVKNIEDIMEKQLRKESYKSKEEKEKEKLWYQMNP